MLVPATSHFSASPSFRTHIRFVAVREPSFEGCTELSRSGNVRRWLATGEDSTLYLTTTNSSGPLPTIQSIPILNGGIVLCESSTSGKGKGTTTTWNVAVPVPAPTFVGMDRDDRIEPASRIPARGKGHHA